MTLRFIQKLTFREKRNFVIKIAKWLAFVCKYVRKTAKGFAWIKKLMTLTVNQGFSGLLSFYHQFINRLHQFMSHLRQRRQRDILIVRKLDREIIALVQNKLTDNGHFSQLTQRPEVIVF